MNISEHLSLDPERLRLAIDVYEGFARASLEDASLEALVVSGSCLTIAASFASVVDVRSSKKLFHSAAEAYHKQAHRHEMAVHEHREEPTRRIHEGKMSFARVLAVCGTDMGQVERFFQTSMGSVRSFHSPDTMASLLLAETMLEMSVGSFEFRSVRHRLMEGAAGMQSFEVGRTRLSLAHFLRLAQLPEKLDRPRESIRELAVGVLNRLEDSMEGAVRSRHWKYLQCSMLPIEPEVLGMCLAMDGACRRAFDNRSNLMEVVGNEVREMASAYVRVAVEFGGNDSERDRERQQ